MGLALAEEIKMKTFLAYVPITAVVLLLLGGCALFPQAQGAVEGVKAAKVVVTEARYRAAMKNEELRCNRSVELVMKMGDALGGGWFASYVGDCPNMQAFIKRALATFELVPIAAPRS